MLYAPMWHIDWENFPPKTHTVKGRTLNHLTITHCRNNCEMVKFGNWNIVYFEKCWSRTNEITNQQMYENYTSTHLSRLKDMTGIIESAVICRSYDNNRNVEFWMLVKLTPSWHSLSLISVAWDWRRLTIFRTVLNYAFTRWWHTLNFLVSSW